MRKKNEERSDFSYGYLQKLPNRQFTLFKQIKRKLSVKAPNEVWSVGNLDEIGVNVSKLNR